MQSSEGSRAVGDGLLTNMQYKVPVFPGCLLLKPDCIQSPLAELFSDNLEKLTLDQ